MCTVCVLDYVWCGMYGDARDMTMNDFCAKTHFFLSFFLFMLDEHVSHFVYDMKSIT